MMDDEQFLEATGMGGPDVSHLMFENEFGFTSIDQPTFQRKVLELADAIHSTDGDYLKHLYEADPALRPRMVEAALRSVLHIALLGQEGVLQQGIAFSRIHQVTVSYRRITAGEDKSWGELNQQP